MVEVLLYVLFCVITAAFAVNRRMGFWGALIISLLITPLPVLAILVLTGPSHRSRQHWHHHWSRNRPGQDDRLTDT
jgi:hypothetical protein